MVPESLDHVLLSLSKQESLLLSESATLSVSAKRRIAETKPAYRQQFALDADRILHSRAYIRYIDKTQVFSLVDNDHITHRVLHVQLVARIARTIARFLRLNEDLTEAIALGHDIGHPPFGHDGEKFLSELCKNHGLPPFQHNIQSVRFLDKLERKGIGWNLTLQVLDGILCHDGEVHSQDLIPQPISDFVELGQKILRKSKNPKENLIPATSEGCVVRLADTIAYIGRDIEDAITLGLIKRSDLPANSTALLGNTNGTIVYNLVTDLIENTLTNTEETPPLGFTPAISDALKELKAFNYEKIYFAPEIKEFNPMIKNCYQHLFLYYLEQLTKNPGELPAETDLMTDISPLSLDKYSKEERVRDFIAGMTDNYFLRQAKQIGCKIPHRV